MLPSMMSSQCANIDLFGSFTEILRQLETTQLKTLDTKDPLKIKTKHKQETPWFYHEPIALKKKTYSSCPRIFQNVSVFYVSFSARSHVI